MSLILRAFFYLVIGRLVTGILLGLNIISRSNLPRKGPAIIACNHNSHLDIMVIMSALNWRTAMNTHPVAAADYFMCNPFMRWFSTQVVGIIPLKRHISVGDRDVFAACHAALQQNKLLIIFPEGSRGEPEHLSELKSGIAHLVRQHPHTPVIPMFIRGLGKTLPRGEALFVPFFCDVIIDRPIIGITQKEAFMTELNARFQHLAKLAEKQEDPQQATVTSD